MIADVWLCLQTGTARADLFGIASPDPAGGQQCSASASLDPPQPAGHDFMPDPWEDQFIYSQVQHIFEQCVSELRKHISKPAS